MEEGKWKRRREERFLRASEFSKLFSASKLDIYRKLPTASIVGTELSEQFKYTITQ